MKNSIIYTGILLAFTLAGCTEKPPYINYDPPKTTIDTTYVNATPSDAQTKQVLLEDVTGVQCVNCPDAAAIAKALTAANPGKINVIAVHALNLLDNFTKPVNKEGHKSKQDFRTQAAADICVNILGVPNSLPKGGIDRVKFSDKTDLLIDRTDWTSKVNAQLAVSTPVNITLASVPGAAGEILIDATIEYTQALPDTNYLTLVIVEDSIIDVQEYIDYTQPIPSPEFNDNYLHMHVMRAVMTASTGDLINKPDAPLVAGRVFRKRYKYTITNSEWVRKNLHVIGFVHRNGAQKTVLQSNHTEVQ